MSKIAEGLGDRISGSWPATLSPADLVDMSSNRVGELGRALATVASRLRQTLDSQLAEPAGSSWALADVCLRMSINLEAEAGVVISRTKTGAAFKRR